jgi:hypothetical protein
MTSTQELLRERNAYANAWSITGKVMAPLFPSLSALGRTFPEAWYPWIMILNKLIRILGTPKHLDSWRDIVGYAQLVVDHLTKKEN